MGKRKSKEIAVAQHRSTDQLQPELERTPLSWLRARYSFHTFSYRDPRAPYSTALAIPVVSPTAVLLGVASTLFQHGRVDAAKAFLARIHVCRAVIDAPKAVVFFRAFHQTRRYETDKYEKTNPRLGLTQPAQSTREYGIPQGAMTVFVGVPSECVADATFALENREHIGTRDSLCSLLNSVEEVASPHGVVFLAPEDVRESFPCVPGLTVVTLSRFRGPFAEPSVGTHWWMSGGENTELVPYLIQGRYEGTSRGKIFVKDVPPA